MFCTLLSCWRSPPLSVSRSLLLVSSCQETQDFDDGAGLCYLFSRFVLLRPVLSGTVSRPSGVSTRARCARLVRFCRCPCSALGLVWAGTAVAMHGFFSSEPARSGRLCHPSSCPASVAQWLSTFRFVSVALCGRRGSWPSCARSNCGSPVSDPYSSAFGAPELACLFVALLCPCAFPHAPC